MPRKLDHTAHPYLIDLIIAASTLPTQLTIRSTCRALRDRVDTHLASHVVVLPIERSNDARLHLPNLTNPFTAGQSILHAPGTSSLRGAPGVASTLDVLSEPAGADLLPGIILSQFASVTTLRRFGPAAITRPYSALTQVHTVVDCIQGGWEEEPPEIRYLPLVKRHVIHFLWDEAGASNLHRPRGVADIVLDELVLVLWPFPPGRVRPAALYWLISDIVAVRAAQMTIVGLEKVHPAQVLASNDGMRGTIERGDVRSLADVLGDISRETDTLPPAYYTLEEWRASLAEEERDVLCPPGLGDCRPARAQSALQRIEEFFSTDLATPG
ncbi:uncharacterized protein LOC62_04G005313 [Vanrija pseudolonga]|uniref:Uncharacterized protein n=1 Tax=Vanrija pseudolonga TaxID=143232 RepID=A0AAF1BIP3_9TREE|nr:hypothetical protein LOC62_04G005313 [Vanrija pseudolonga]